LEATVAGEAHAVALLLKAGADTGQPDDPNA
jgi:hypothetical protein